jgi:hypothetical protein
VFTSLDGVGWDGSILEEGVRTYAATLDGESIGRAEYRLEKAGEDWLSTATVTVLGTTQVTRLRFDSGSLDPRMLTQETLDGPLRTGAEVTVSGGRLRGSVDLPPHLGGRRTFDEPLSPGILLPGMDEYALAVAPLAQGARLMLQTFDLVAGQIVRLEAQVRGEVEIEVPAGPIPSWRVELTGGATPMTLFLRKEAPHVLVRQEFGGQMIQFELETLAPL